MINRHDPFLSLDEALAGGILVGNGPPPLPPRTKVLKEHPDGSRDVLDERGVIEVRRDLGKDHLGNPLVFTSLYGGAIIRRFGPPKDSSVPMQHGDGSGGGGGGAGQSKKRTRRDGKNVGGPRPGSRATLSVVIEREQHAMGLAWKMVKNEEGEMERRLELVPYQARAGQGKKKKPDGEKKKGKKGGKQMDDGDDMTKSRGTKKKNRGNRTQ